MSDTVDLRVLKAMYTLLKGSVALDDVTFSDRWFSLDQDRLPAVDIDLLDANVSSLSKRTHAYELTVAVTVQAADDHALDRGAAEVADPIIGEVHQLLMADRTLGGLVAEINPTGRRWRRSEIDGAVVAVECFYRMQYAVEAADLRQLAR